MSGLPSPTSKVASKGLPALKDSEDAVSRSPRARRDEAAKTSFVRKVWSGEGPGGEPLPKGHTVSTGRPATADDLEDVGMDTINKVGTKGNSGVRKTTHIKSSVTTSDLLKDNE